MSSLQWETVEELDQKLAYRVITQVALLLLKASESSAKMIF